MTLNVVPLRGATLRRHTTCSILWVDNMPGLRKHGQPADKHVRADRTNARWGGRT